LTDIYVDGDACPVREEIYRVAVSAAKAIAREFKSRDPKKRQKLGAGNRNQVTK
jgi:uncharacterized protein YaiI (UPF0178 family)